MNKTKIEILGICYYLGLGFLNEVVTGTGKQLNELSAESDELLMPKLIYYSRLYACKRLGLNTDFTLDDVFEYIDDNGGMGGQFFKDWFNAYIIAMTKDVPQDDSEDKKKVTKAKK